MNFSVEKLDTTIHESLEVSTDHELKQSSPEWFSRTGRFFCVKACYEFIDVRMGMQK